MNTKLAFTGERMVPDHPNLYAALRIYKLVAEKYGNRDGMVLDYGCGSGYGTMLLSAFFKKVVGIDVSKESIDYCRRVYQKDNIEFHVLDPGSQPYSDESFDCIFSFQVFEHMPPSEASLYIMSVWRMLKPGGVAIITTPNAHNYYGGYSGNPFHVKEYTSGELIQAFASIIPSNCFRVFAVADVPNTRMYIAVRRLLKSSVHSHYIAGLAAKVIRAFEKIGVLSIHHKHMLKTKNIDQVIGSYYVQVNKS